MEELLREIIGPDSNAINWWQMCIRGVIIFFITLTIIRIGDYRIFGKNTAFDIALGLIMGSLLSRAITGNAPFVPTIVTCIMLVVLHRLLANLACRTNLGRFIKGREQQLVKEGKLLRDQMNANNITDNDLQEAMRSNGNTQSLEKVESAFLERSGDISVIPKDNN